MHISYGEFYDYHVTNRATGKKMIEKKSKFRLKDNFIDPMVIQCQLVIVSSVSELKKDDKGIRLIKNAYLIHKVTELGKLMCFVILANEMIIGKKKA